ncbi:hypothetical protein MXB_870 [Myxobolus squamalis]|nr:hypothetical protein MXB_870 [Myxobolus squamalis]
MSEILRHVDYLYKRALLIFDIFSQTKRREALLLQTSESTLIYLMFFQALIGISFACMGLFQFYLIKKYLLSKNIIK